MLDGLVHTNGAEITADEAAKLPGGYNHNLEESK